jgi:hypothetical protein
LILELVPARGLPGERVALKGRGFDPAPGGTQVWYGGRPALVLAASERDLQVVVPGGGPSHGPFRGRGLGARARSDVRGPWVLPDHARVVRRVRAALLPGAGRRSGDGASVERPGAAADAARQGRCAERRRARRARGLRLQRLDGAGAQGIRRGRAAREAAGVAAAGRRSCWSRRCPRTGRRIRARTRARAPWRVTGPRCCRTT